MIETPSATISLEYLTDLYLFLSNVEPMPTELEIERLSLLSQLHNTLGNYYYYSGGLKPCATGGVK